MRKYIYDGNVVHKHILNSCREPHGIHHNEQKIAGVGKLINGVFVAGFTLRAVGGLSYELSAAAPHPQKITKGDLAHMFNYLLNRSGATSILAFTMVDNFKAQALLFRIGFREIGLVPNHYGFSKSAILYSLDFDFANELRYYLNKFGGRFGKSALT